MGYFKSKLIEYEESFGIDTDIMSDEQYEEHLRDANEYFIGKAEMMYDERCVRCP